MTNHFYAIDPQGQAHTRSSQNRTYTHTVIFLRGAVSQAAALAQAQRSTLPGSIETHDTYTAWAQCKRGTLSAHERKDAGKPIVEGDYLHQCGLKHVAQYASAEAYEAMLLAHRLKNHERDVARGYYSQWQNAGWCSRADLARKLVAKGNAAYQHMILEAQAGKPPKA